MELTDVVNTLKLATSFIQKEMTKNPVLVQKELDPDVTINFVAVLTAAVDATAVSSAEKQKLVALVQKTGFPPLKTVPKTGENSQLQFINKVVDISVVAQRESPALQTIQKTIQSPELQHSVKKKSMLSRLCRFHGRRSRRRQRCKKKVASVVDTIGRKVESLKMMETRQSLG